MTASIFEEIRQEFIDHGRQDIDGIRSIFRDVTSQLHHQPERHTEMSALTDIETELGAFADRLKTAIVPVVHDGAAALDRSASSRIVQELETLAAPLAPADEEMVAGMIRSLGVAAARIAELTSPPVEAEPAA